MKFLLKFFMSILLAMPMVSVAQEVRVLSEGIDFVGGIGSVHRKTILLQNESIQAKTYILKSLRGGIGSSQKVKLCIGDQRKMESTPGNELGTTLSRFERYSRGWKGGMG